MKIIVTTCLLFCGIAIGEEIKTLNPDTVPQPYKNRFSHGKLIPAGAEWLFTAGQTGRNVDGEIGKDIEEQADWAMQNLYAIIRDGGMDSEDVIKMTISNRSKDASELERINLVVKTLCDKHGYIPESANELLKYVSSIMSREDG